MKELCYSLLASGTGSWALTKRGCPPAAQGMCNMTEIYSRLCPNTCTHQTYCMRENQKEGLVKCYGLHFIYLVKKPEAEVWTDLIKREGVFLWMELAFVSHCMAVRPPRGWSQTPVGWAWCFEVEQAVSGSGISARSVGVMKGNLIRPAGSAHSCSQTQTEARRKTCAGFVEGKPAEESTL